MSDNTKSTTLVRGLRCPGCGSSQWRVIYTRWATGDKIMRRRECKHCGKRTDHLGTEDR